MCALLDNAAPGLRVSELSIARVSTGQSGLGRLHCAASESSALVPLMTLCSSLTSEFIDFLCQPSTLENSTLLQN